VVEAIGSEAVLHEFQQTLLLLLVEVLDLVRYSRIPPGAISVPTSAIMSFTSCKEAVVR
jgi:hypothetical protein